MGKHKKYNLNLAFAIKILSGAFAKIITDNWTDVLAEAGFNWDIHTYTKWPLILIRYYDFRASSNFALTKTIN